MKIWPFDPYAEDNGGSFLYAHDLDLALEPWRKIATLAEAWQRPVAPHDCNGPVVWVASIHFMAHIPNALIMEVVRAYYSTWYKDILTDLPQVRAFDQRQV